MATYEEELSALQLKWRKIHSFDAFLAKYPHAGEEEVVDGAIAADLGHTFDFACEYLGRASDLDHLQLPIADTRNPLRTMAMYVPPQARFFFCSSSKVVTGAFSKAVDDVYDRIANVLCQRGGYMMICPSYAEDDQGLIVALVLDETAYGTIVKDDCGLELRTMSVPVV